MSQLLNPNPEVSDVSQSIRRTTLSSNNEFEEEPIDEMEIFDLIRDINDPEHPLTLEQLKVISHDQIKISHQNKIITIHFTPTITHCSLATLIGLSLRVKLLRSIPAKYKIDIMVTPGSYQSEEALNKQLNDKERVAAAMENGKLLSVVNKCIGEI